jgi:plasmid maintenance system killer protein
LDVILNNKELVNLYTCGKSRKLKLPDQVIDKFFATIQKIEAAININDLRKDNGLHFEKLKGFDCSYSMRLSLKYRLEITIEWIDENQTIGKFYLNTISNHYS